MRCNEIIGKFKKFFTEKGYVLLAPFPLTPSPELDKLDNFFEFDITYRPSIGANTIIKTLNEGIGPFVVVQNCYRHKDVINNRVGDGRHLGFFRMAGIIGRLEEKDKLIADAYEFLNSFNMKKDKIWASYFGGAEGLRGKVRGVDLSGKTKTLDMEPQDFSEDLEMKKRFLSFGFPESRTVSLKRENFSGIIPGDPYGGPCAHLYYELSEEPCSDECYPEHNEECNRFLELCIFAREYLVKKKQNNGWMFVPMDKKRKKPFIGIGFGVERFGQILQGVREIEKIDTIQTPMDNLRRKHPDIFQDWLFFHLLQCALFLISEGGIPKSKSRRKTQLRELMKMISKLGEANLKDERAFKETMDFYLTEIADYFKDEYPYLLENMLKELTYYVINKE